MQIGAQGATCLFVVYKTCNVAGSEVMVGDLRGYSDRRGGGGGRERVTVRVQYAYYQSYCDLPGYCDRGTCI